MRTPKAAHAAALVVSCLLISAIACAPLSGQEETKSEADVQAITTLLEQWAAGLNAVDPDAMMAWYADDVVMMIPDAPALVGKEAIRPGLQAMMATVTVEFGYQVDEIEVSGDLASLRITFEETMSPKSEDEPMQIQGYALRVLQRQADGSWKVWREVWSIISCTGSLCSEAGM